MKKDAGVAALLNTILPGLGWIYCEYILGGIISIFIDKFNMSIKVLRFRNECI
ncbi:MAG: hypothetical protein IJ738_01345 [Alphaproteobacteria bacterium]|nr:hypothetical protein [Alphaproteobacteria bacterium]